MNYNSFSKEMRRASPAWSICPRSLLPSTAYLTSLFNTAQKSQIGNGYCGAPAAPPRPRWRPGAQPPPQAAADTRSQTPAAPSSNHQFITAHNIAPEPSQRCRTVQPGCPRACLCLRHPTEYPAQPPRWRQSASKHVHKQMDDRMIQKSARARLTMP
eukprot:365665-Chlamydomonas_euryale.AAC.8